MTFVAPVQARTYYVSSTHGSDANSGSESAPWKTIARLNRQLLQPGDSALLRRGDSWRETLRPHSSGRPGLPVLFGSYGDGAAPILEGDLTAGTDVNIDNNEQSYIVYRELNLRRARQGLRLYAWRGRVRGITLENSVISTERSEPHGTMSAGVYAIVGSGTIANVVIRDNKFHPHAAGLENWGVYFVKGVVGFRIEGNTFGPAGEDAICVWHSANGLIARNSGGGNGENTIDVKDSREIVITGNRADSDAEYNIVVHAVDRGTSTERILVKQNRCRRGGQGRQLTAGIALLFVEQTRVAGNIVEDPYGAGIYARDARQDSGNAIVTNIIRGAKPRTTSGISLEDAPGTQVRQNTFLPQ
jgi:Periplasmic copper-binding protein (NosD)